MTSLSAITNRKRRVLILLVLLGIAGFFWNERFEPKSHDRYAPASGETFALSPTGGAFGLGQTSFETVERIIGPDPAEFQLVSTERSFGDFISPYEITIRDICNDTYYVVLVFQKGVDYRSAPTAAIYNSATPCVKGESVNKQISFEEAGMTTGEYYYFVADQGVEGSWYNPR